MEATLRVREIGEVESLPPGGSDILMAFVPVWTVHGSVWWWHICDIGRRGGGPPGLEVIKNAVTEGVGTF